MVSFTDIVKAKDEEHKLDSISDEYECVKIEDVLNKNFIIDKACVYIDKKSEDGRKKVAIGLTTEDGKKYRVHTGAIRIVEIFEEVEKYNAENPDNPISLNEEQHKIVSQTVNKGIMFLLE